MSQNNNSLLISGGMKGSRGLVILTDVLSRRHSLTEEPVLHLVSAGSRMEALL